MQLVTDFILTTGIVLTVLVLLLLVRAKKKELHRTVLVLFFVFILFVNLYAYANFHGIEALYKVSFLFDFTIIWFFGPLLLLYIKSLFEPSYRLVSSHLIHFIPGILLNRAGGTDE